MEEDKLSKWLEERYDEGHIDGEESLSKYMAVLDNVTIDPVDADTLFANIKAETIKKESPRAIKLVPWMASIAASLLVLVGLFFLLSNNLTTVESDRELLSHVLPDKSIITLKKGSQITYDDDFGNRIVKLEGEAFFKVEKGSTFEVKTDNGVVEVLGTSFNVFARDHYLKVECKTGKVQVSQDGKSEILIPGDKVLFANGASNRGTIAVDEVDSWVKGESNFESVPLNLVLISMEEQFQIKFEGVSTDVNDRNFSGSYLNNDLDKSLKMVLTPMGINYKITEDKIIELF